MSAILVVSPSHLCNAWLSIAAVRAGETGILDLGYKNLPEVQRAAVEELSQRAGNSQNWGVRWDTLGDRGRDPLVLKELLYDVDCPILVLAGLGGSGTPLRDAREQARGWAGQVLVEVHSLAEAIAATEAGFDGVIVKANEAAGRVSEESAFTLLQKLHGKLRVPYWVQGGFGPDTAAAAWLSGASGIVLGEQLWLASESPFDATEKRRWAQTDGSQTTCLGDDDLRFRVFTGAGREALSQIEQSIASGADWQAQLREALGDPQRLADDRLIPLGRDIALAGRLADKHVNVAGILTAFRKQAEENLGRARRDHALAPGSPLAKSLGIEYPILYGPLSGVSDASAFSDAVGNTGGMPFLTPNSLRGEAVRKLLTDTAEQMGDRHWGVGLVGTISDDLRNAQFEAVRDLRPRFAIIAGEQTTQARELEACGVSTFFQVTDPALLAGFLRDGAQKFIFAGSENSDPADAFSSFSLWQSAVDTLLDAEIEQPEHLHVVFSGGIRDGLSAALVAVVAGQLTARGIKIGVATSLAHSPTSVADGEAPSLAASHEDICAGGAALLEKLATRRLPWHRATEASRAKSDDIAIVGMACMFPQANDLRAYWQNIFGRVDAIEEVPAERWNADDYFDEDRFAPDRVYSKWGGFLGKMTFDPMKWRIPPASLRSIEPIQLLSLEVAARAMQDAGYDRREFPRERAGVIFAAAGSHDLGSGYAFRTMMRHYLPLAADLAEADREKIFASLEEQLPEWTEDSFPGFLINVIAGRIARELNLNGPNYVVDAACAASLAALHAAIEQLRMRTSDMMLVGAADATNNPFCYMCFSKTHALSPSGHSRPFDDAADGISLGEGIAVMVLKRLDDAERDGDKIYAVIKGIGSSSDGKNRSLTAPHPPGQVKAVVRAYDDAQVSPATISLVEAHGTGTAVGDGAEVTTLSQVFNEYTERKQFVAVGSVKSMIGHTKTVAGMASMIKSALALKHGVLPPTIGVDKPTTRIDFKTSPFYLNTETRPWLDELGGEPRRAAVSAFGFGGTNFHVVMEEYQENFHPADELDLSPRTTEVFVWQRASRDEIVQTLEQLNTRIADVPTTNLALLANSVSHEEHARTVRAAACRLGMVAGTVDELRKKVVRALQLLKTNAAVTDPTGIYYSENAPVTADQVCFLYPGQGSQAVNMLRDLALTSRWSDQLFARANSLLADFLPEPISKYIFPPPVFCEEDRQAQFQALSETRVAQPALGIMELFATSLMERYGIRPGKVAGHSYGELVALHIAGCLSERELLWLSAMRGKVCSEVAHAAPGGMAAVRADAKTTLNAIREFDLDVHLANMNAPDQTVIGGTDGEIAAAVEKLTAKGLKISRLPVSAAFHTPLLAAGSEAMAVHFGLADFQKPNIPVYSNTTGEIHGESPVVMRELLTQHFSEPVQYEKEIRQLYADGARVFIEAGPGKVLSSLVGRILKDQPVTALALDAPGRDGWTQFGHLLAQSFALGLPVELGAWFQGRGLATLNVDEFCEQARALAIPKRSDWIIGPGKSEPVTPLPARKSNGSGLRAKFGMKPAAAPPAATDPAGVKTPSENGAISTPISHNGGSSSNPVAAGQADAAHRANPLNTSASLPQSNQGHSTTPAMPLASPSVAPVRAPSVAIPAAVISAPPIHHSPKTLQRTTTTMTNSNGDPAVHAQPAQAAGHAGVEMFGEFQATTRQLLEFQHSQQRLIERFLDSQERMMAYCLGGVPANVMLPAAAPPQRTISAPVQSVAPAAPLAAQPAAAAPIRVASAPVRAPIAVPTVSAPAVRAAAPAVPVSAPAVQVAAAQPVARPAPAVVAAPVGALVGQNGHDVAKHAPMAPASAAAAAGGPPPTDDFRRDLLDIVSERTGYPVDMLDVTLPLEAGLGIDSIKTVEIFSNLKTYHEFFADEDQDEEEQLVEFTKLKTLKDIIDSYDRRRQAIIARSGGGGGASAKAQEAPAEKLNGQGNGQVERYALSAVETPLDSGSEKKNSLSAS